jgi:hypothetical protein
MAHRIFFRAASCRVTVFLRPPRPRRPRLGVLGFPWRGPLCAALLLAAAVPAACGEGRDRARVAALEAGIASAQASLAALSVATPSAPPPSFGSPAPARPAAAEAARLSAGAKPIAASGLLGAGPDALRRWFGEPDLRRPEGDAEVLLFLGSGCALDVVLYADGVGAKRVDHAAARADGPAAVTEAECLRGIADGAGTEEVGRAVAAGHTPRR